MQLSEASKHLAFLATFKHMSDIAAGPDYRNKIIIADRYYFCSLAMHAPLAALTNEVPLPVDYAVFGFEKPDFAFYLDLDETSRRQRLVARGKSASPVEKLLDADPKFNEEVRANYRMLVARGLLTAIPVASLSKEEVVGAIFEKINPR